MATLTNIGGPPGRARWAGFGWLLASLPFFGVVGTVAAQTETPVFDGPRMAIEVREKDFGTVTRGEILEATFEVKSVGSEPLKILQVKPG